LIVKKIIADRGKDGLPAGNLDKGESGSILSWYVTVATSPGCSLIRSFFFAITDIKGIPA
jgi:hypothetical protein